MSAVSGRYQREFDPVLLLVAVALVAFGAALIYSGSLNSYGKPSFESFDHPVVRQAIFAAVGLTLSIVVARFDYRTLGTSAWALYVISLALLAFVLAVGESAYGSRRWIDIAGTRVQPSEIAKLVTVVVLSRYLSDHQAQIKSLRVLLISLGIALLPAGLVFAEPDLGSAVMFLAIWLGLVAIAGVPWRHLFGLLALGLSAVPFAMVALISDYQRERIALWLDPQKDALGSGFNILQAEISIGSGGLWGKGFTHGTQTQLDILRTQTTDYVFSVLGEELGLMGALLLFALFIVLLFRGIRAAGLASDLMGRLLASGVVLLILFQVFINIAVNVRIFPVTGIPLPFISQGGSSLITMCIALGLVQSVLMYRKRIAFYAGDVLH